MKNAASMRLLPARPSLEHLRKEAKDSLVQLRARAGSAQLADAQLLVARSYGFSSWRVLKQEVERRRDALGLPPIILGDSFPRPRQPTGFRAMALSPVNAEQTFFRVLSVPLMLALGAQLLGILAAFLLG